MNRYVVMGVAVELQHGGAFVPTVHGQFYASVLRVEPGERVIDIGCGSGVLAIAAAKLGAYAFATDIDMRAVQDTRHNASLNGVDVHCDQGSLFGPFHGPFDVIMANLPNEIAAPSYLETLSAADAATFAGGPSGNAALRALLDAAPAYMHRSSRMYMGVHTLTDYHDTFDAMLERYSVRMLGWSRLPLKGHALQHLGYFQQLNDAGVVHMVQDRAGEWPAFGYMFELGLSSG